MRDKTALKLLIIAVLCLVVYGPSLANGFIWDDDAYVYNNTVLTSSSALKDIWFSYKTPQYYPFVFTTFWIEHKLWGFNPLGYHIVNLILHILNSLLVFMVVKRLYPRFAFIVALIFCIHPIQVETVAWITERKNLLGLFFFLVTLLSYLRFERTKKGSHYLKTLVFFACALLSKSVTVCFVTVPVIYQWWKKNKVTWSRIGFTIPFAALGVLSAVNTIYLELYRVGAKWDTWTLDALGRLILSGRIILFYIYKILLPFEFIFFYPRWQVDTHQWWQWMFIIISFFILILLFRRRKRIGRGGFALFAFYIISLFPALGFITVYPMKYSYVADHFSYLSTPALLLLICASITFIFDLLGRKFSLLKSNASRLLGRIFLILIVIFLCAQSIILTKSYKDQLTLWQHTIQKNPKAWMAYNNLGIIYKESGKTEKAMAAYNKAIEIKPDYENTYYNIGNAYIQMGQHKKAISFYQKAIELSPNYAQCHNNLGNAYKDSGRLDEAIASYKKAIRLNPLYAMAYSNLGVAYLQKNQKEEAMELFKKSIQIDPVYAETYNNLASLYYESGDIQKSIPLYTKAIALKPGYAEAYSNLAVAYMRQKDYRLAIEYADKAKSLGLANAGLLKALEPYRRQNFNRP